MKNILGKVAALAVLVFSQTANANSAEHSSGFYAVPKAVIVLGDTIIHESHELNGDSGVGVGLDLGYSFTENYALELSTAYAEADVVEDGHTKAEAKYTTYGASAVYTKHIIGHLGLLAKLGYSWEYEKIEDFHIKNTLGGIAYVAGLEYGVANDMELVFEYEGAEVVSSAGNSLMLGLKYKF